MNFERRKNPLGALGIGQEQLIRDWLDEMDIARYINYTINDDYTIDVDRDVDLFGKNLYEFPKFIQFNNVNGSFYCNKNHLSSLRGCPRYVNGIFYCNINEIQFTEEYVRSLCVVKGEVYV
jgi:hypothetical protein